jgi:hypothetical protein
VGKPSDTPQDEAPSRNRWRTGFRPGRKKRVVAGALVVAALLAVAVWAVVGINYLIHRPPDPRLIGTWQSDADATIEELRKVRPKTAEMYRKQFGRTRATFSAATLTTERKTEKGIDVVTVPYQVVSKDQESVVVRTLPVGERMELEFRIRFISTAPPPVEPPANLTHEIVTMPDTYWVDMPTGISECYRRVKPQAPRRGE